MQVIICYDVSDNKLRYKLVKHLEKIAVRVQLSVFKAELKPAEISKLDKYAKKLLHNGEKGNVLIYHVEQEFTRSEQNFLPEAFIVI
nr:CRISPR-associated endonuclease Cas2 [Phascolarctobacterium succinatutens]